MHILCKPGPCLGEAPILSGAEGPECTAATPCSPSKCSFRSFSTNGVLEVIRESSASASPANLRTQVPSATEAAASIEAAPHPE